MNNLGLNLTNQEAENIGVSPLLLEEIKKSSILETDKKWSPSTVANLLKENPEIVLSEIIRVLNLLDNGGWWYGILPVSNNEGINFVRITIRPPETHDIKIEENKETEEKMIILNKF